ncbi:deoxynucleotidyltransferase terminal-interacting protein 2 [Dasypus novemcinctus]|uniref:deoxynucleotidyltransferase terminal-interacting protein 2 n=1 Tax=Dasypus novemcinctus TaxID=9361 RepID=UPI0003289FEB|nr:deoxynucleotidyltransferase terminal-interacting protein 2 [Dasypus novemcinctus]
MVVTRSARSQAGISTLAAESSLQKESAGRGITRSKNKEHPESKKESQSDDQRTAKSLTNQKQSPIPRTPKTGRKSRTRGSLPEKIETSTDGDISEAESNCSVSELQDTILRVTRRRQILVPCTPLSSVRKRPKITPISESHTEEEVSEAESHVSGISRIVPSTVITTRTRKCKSSFLTDASQESHAEDISDAESSCSDASSFTGIATTRTTRSMQRKLRAQTKEKDSMSVSENEKQIIAIPVNSEDSSTIQTSQLLARPHAQINKPDVCNNETYNDFDNDSFSGISEKILKMQKSPSFNVRDGGKTKVTSLKEMTKQNSKSLDEEAKGIIDEGKEINEENSQLKSLSEPHDTTGLQQLASQRHSTPETSKTSSESSHPNSEAIMKSLAQTFAVVEVDRWDEDRQYTIKRSALTPFVGGDSDDSDAREECTIIGVDKDMNNEKNVDFECGTKSYIPESYTSQDKGDSVLLVLSSDESQQSTNSDNEEDTVCFVENGGQKESLSDQDSGNTSCDNALFVIDTTPGLSSDKNFYLEEKDKAGEVTTEEENEQEEEEDEDSEEDLSDNDKNKDELSDEDLLNNTKSKLLKLTSSNIDPGLSIKQLGGLYINFNADKLQSKRTLTQIKEKKKNELLQKTVITPDFEKNYCVPPYSESKLQLQKKRKKERQKTAGGGWFGMKAPELTDELKNDLKALKMRASMDPKRFYKKNDRDGFPKYFQIGTIVDNPADFYHSRIPKKQRKRTIVEELLADSEFRRYNRRKYSEIMAERAANAAGKKFRKKKKFRN